MVLAFKLHGDFIWPPSPVISANQARRAGTVELWLLERIGTCHAALRFIPDEAQLDQADLSAGDVASIPFGSSASDELAIAANDHLAHPTTRPLPAFWLEEAARAQGLTFRGAQLIEEYKADATLALQLPLANGIIYGNFLNASDAANAANGNADPASARASVATFSGLRVFLDAGGAAAFAFPLHLPLPVRQSKESSARSFPIILQYSAKWPTQPPLPLEMDRLQGGWVNDAGIGGTGVNLDIGGIPTGGRWLGNFGFSERGSIGVNGDKFVIYGNRNAGHYWPSNAECFVNDVVNSYGFSVSSTHWLDYSDGDPADLSLRFSKRQDGPFVGLIYRVRVDRDPNGGTGNAGSDLKAYVDDNKNSILTLRLARELGGIIGNEPYFGTDGASVDEVEGWLRTGSRLSADCALSWDIEDRVRSMDRTLDWRPVVTLRLHWAEVVSSTSAERVNSDELFQAGLIGPASYSFLQVRSALPEGETGQPGSFLPRLSMAEMRRVRFSLYGTPIAATMSPWGLISWGQQLAGGNPSQLWNRPPMRLSLARRKDLIENTADTRDEFELSLQATEISFFRPPAVSVDLVLEHDESWPPTAPGAVDAGFFASFALHSSCARGWSGRLASLEFEAKSNLEVPTKEDRLNGHLRVGGAGSASASGRGAARLLYPGGRAAAEISLPVALSEVTPVTIDVQRFDRTGRAAPLLIDLGESDKSAVFVNANAPIRYWLRATETILPREDRRLTAEVFDKAKDVLQRSYAVLSSQPFSVFRFTQQPLASRGGQEGTSVAVYDGDTRSWQYKLVSRHYRYSLPSQAIGESADKPGRLEIHDLGPGELPVPLPFVRHEKVDGSLDVAPSNRERRAVEYRLTPSAEIWITPSDVARGYFMPEASSHDIFRQYGGYGLGAPLAYLRAEFLYGLSVGVDVSKESAVARGARVAEIEALVGRPMGPARETDAEPLVADRWDALREAIARRPERLEVWARDIDSSIDFTPARFSQGTAFSLRGTALHRAPVIDGTAMIVPEGSEDNATWPRSSAGVWPPEAEKGVALPARNQVLPRLHPQGLSGGALWPVESLNLLNTLLLEPQSGGGTIERIALSPIGGDASQKAEFLSGQLAIISETNNGRVLRLQLEVIGRIGALWHRAKHVVVYERTVNPSAQFAPRKDPKGTRSRRPIMRKVREYIELLQPERGYPDFSAATARNAGFLNRVRFNSRIINVDSAWSSEVGEFGWQVPLWNRLSARERPQVYPMPDVAFVTNAEGDGDQPVVAQECLDPDHLYFFADFKAGTSDTDRWETRLGIDFSNMPAAARVRDIADRRQTAPPPKIAAGDPEPRRPPVSRILPGLRRFTWRLAPASQKTALNAGRAGKPVFVGLESVSFMRATHQEDAHKKLSSALQAASDISLKRVDDGLRYWSGDGVGVHTSLVPTAATLTDQFKVLAELDTSAPDYLTKVDTAVRAIAGTKAAAKAAVGGLLPPDLKLPPLQSGLPVQALCQKLKDDATSTINRKELLVRMALSDFVAELDRQLEAAELTLPIDRAQFIVQQTQDAVAYIRPLFDEASQDISKVELAVERARAIILETGEEFGVVFDRARQRLQQFREGYDDSKPWSPSRREAFRAGAEAAVAGAIGDVQAAIDEAAQRLSAELGDVGQQIAGHISKALHLIDVEQSELIGEVVRFEGMADAYLSRLDAQLLGVDTDSKLKLADLNDKIATHPKLSAKPDLQTKLLNAVSAVKGTLTTTHDKARAAGSRLDAEIDGAVADFRGALAKFSNDLHALGASFLEESKDLFNSAQDLVDIGAGDLSDLLNEFRAGVTTLFSEVAAAAEAKLLTFGSATDAIVLPMLLQLDSVLVGLREKLAPLPQQVALISEDVSAALAVVQEKLSPSGLLQSQIRGMIEDTLNSLLSPLPASIGDPGDIAVLRRKLQQLANDVAALMRGFSSHMHKGVDEITAACDAVAEGVAQAEAYLNGLVSKGQAYLEEQAEAVYGYLETALKGPLTSLDEAKRLIDAAKDFDRRLRNLQNDVSRSFETANAYGDRVFNAVSNLDHGGLLAAPSNLLKLYSAVTSAPELAALRADIDRIRSTFDEIGDIIEVTKTNAMFNRLGDELKALGLSIPFDKIGDRLLPADLSSLDIGSVFRNFGGAKLDRLFKGYKIPAGVRDAVKITHDFDKKQARAWVQVDIAALFTGRRSLFSLGVFQADFIDMKLTGRVRLEVSSEQEKVAVTGFGHIATTLDAVVGGQSMVKFEKFGLEFTKEKGLDVQFDPKNAKLNPQFKWVQDFLSGLFPDLGGGLEWIKENGIPVGVQHDFVLPPLSLTFGTSGVSNISIENHFKLVAFPDFLIADRFNLSSMERPFIFSIFIIGGTGYIQIEAQYRPLKKDSELTVLVEAGAGGSAQLAFAFGPFIGQIFITISGVLSYRKVLGKSGGGLTISMVVVIAGQVDVCGIVTVGITLMLRMSYRDNGQVDADGTLTVTIRISRFFKLRARAQVNYKMRGGKSEMTTSLSADGELEGDAAKLADKAKKLSDSAKKLEEALN